MIYQTGVKDNRKTLNHIPIAVNGNSVRFDGKFNPDNNELVIYRMYGDFRLFGEAVQNYCIDNNIATCKAPSYVN